MILHLAHPLSPFPVSKLDRRHTGRLRKREIITAPASNYIYSTVKCNANVFTRSRSYQAYRWCQNIEIVLAESSLLYKYIPWILAR